MVAADTLQMPTCKWNTVFQHLASTQRCRAALLSSLLGQHCQELDHLHWCFCLLEVVVIPSQVLSTSRQVRLLLFSQAPLSPWQAFSLELAPKSKSHILCVRSRRSTSESGTACCAWDVRGLGYCCLLSPWDGDLDMDFQFWALIQILCDTGQVEWTFQCDCQSNACSDNYLYHMLFLKNIFCSQIY